MRISQFVWEMMEWELHARRSMLTVLRLQLQMEARRTDVQPNEAVRTLNQQAAEVYARLEQNQLRAMRDQDYRRRSMSSARDLSDALRQKLEGSDVPPEVVDHALAELQQLLEGGARPA